MKRKHLLFKEAVWNFCLHFQVQSFAFHFIRPFCLDLGSISSRLRESGFILLPMCAKERGRAKRLEREPILSDSVSRSPLSRSNSLLC